MSKSVACPQCGRPVAWGPESPFRPFCSARCRLIDLGGWFEEDYRITEPSDAPSEDPVPWGGDPEGGEQPH